MKSKTPADPRGSKPCVIDTLTNADYHSLTDIYSKSMLDLFAHRPTKLQAYLKGIKRTESDAMKLGTLAHTALLEPTTLDARYRIHTEGLSKNSNAYKAIAAEAEAAGRIVIDQDTFDEGKAIAKAVSDKFDRIAAKIGGVSPFKMSGGVAESSLFWTDPESGLRCRCRPDWMCFDKKSKSGFIIDLKTTRDLNTFAKSVESFRYDVSAAFYSDGYEAVFGVKPTAYLLAVVESDKPHDVCIQYAPPEIAERGRRSYKRDLMGIKQVLETNEWPSFPDDFVPMELPAWAK